MTHEQIKTLLKEGKSVDDIMDMASRKLKNWGAVFTITVIACTFFSLFLIKINRPIKLHISESQFNRPENAFLIKTKTFVNFKTPSQARIRVNDSFYKVRILRLRNTGSQFENYSFHFDTAPIPPQLKERGLQSFVQVHVDISLIEYILSSIFEAF